MVTKNFVDGNVASSNLKWVFEKFVIENSYVGIFSLFLRTFCRAIKLVQYLILEIHSRVCPSDESARHNEDEKSIRLPCFFWMRLQ